MKRSIDRRLIIRGGELTAPEDLVVGGAAILSAGPADTTMSQMVRKQIDLEAEQAERLKRRAKELGVSGADLIRRCIDQLDRIQGALPVDRKAWQDELTYIRERACAQTALDRQRRWTREELDEERLQHFPR
jgi:hypothetical protein